MVLYKSEFISTAAKEWQSFLRLGVRNFLPGEALEQILPREAEGAPGHGWAMGSLSWGAIQLSSPQQGLELDGLKSLLQPESFYGHSPANVTGTTDLV